MAKRAKKKAAEQAQGANTVAPQPTEALPVQVTSEEPIGLVMATAPTAAAARSGDAANDGMAGRVPCLNTTPYEYAARPTRVERRAATMRFSFCGMLDVPDWLLSEIFVVSKISAVRIKLLAAHVLQQALGMDAPLEKAAKLLGDAKLEPPDIKAVVSALHFILCSAARYDVPDDTLAFELQQLGLPREHTEALTHALREGRTALQQHFAACSLQLPRLASLAWQVHEDTSHVGAHTVELRLGVSEQKQDAAQEVNLRMSADTFTLLHAELKTAKEATARLTGR